MTFFRFDIHARSRKAARLMGRVRRELLKAVMEERSAGLTQQELAQRLQAERATVNRQLSGEAEITLRGLADLAWALDREITVERRRPERPEGQNIGPMTSTVGHQPVRIITPKPRQD
jgi:ribosome-binding protein aMBF1 (putative translation factor)